MYCRSIEENVSKKRKGAAFYNDYMVVPNNKPLTSENFSYDRRYPPLFFTGEDGDIDVCTHRNEQVKRVGKEYYQKLHMEDSTKDDILTNGMTLGEYSMMVIATEHNRRCASDKKKQMDTTLENPKLTDQRTWK